MKIIMTVMIIASIAFAGALNVHILRTEDGLELISKDNMSLRDTYVDVRKWCVDDYFTHSTRISSYLLYTKQYIPLKKALKENAAKYSQKAKEILRPAEEALHGWLSEQLK